MKEYKAGDIRNVAVVGHGASGKTTLVDTLAFVSSSSKRRGAIKDGTTLTDHTPEEIERGYSINVSCAFAEWQGVNARAGIVGGGIGQTQFERVRHEAQLLDGERDQPDAGEACPSA